MIPRSSRAKIKLLAYRKKYLLSNFIKNVSILVFSEVALYACNLNYLSPLGNFGVPFCIVILGGVTLKAYASNKANLFRDAIRKGEIDTIALYIESDIKMNSIKDHLRNEQEVKAYWDSFWGYKDIACIEHDSPGDWGAPPPPEIEYDINRYLYTNAYANTNAQLDERFQKVAEDMRILLEFANQKPLRESTDRALVYSTNYNSTKRQNIFHFASRPGLPNDNISGILAFSKYPRTRDTDRLRQYEIEDAVSNPRPKRNSFCTRLMNWFL